MKNQAQERITMEQADNLRQERKRVLRTIVHNIVLKGHQWGQPILTRIPEDEIPDTPLEEFERGIEEFFKEPGNHKP
jgi:hypothetical protein